MERGAGTETQGGNYVDAVIGMSLSRACFFEGEHDACPDNAEIDEFTCGCGCHVRPDAYKDRCADCGEYADGEVYCYGCGYIRHCEERAEVVRDRGWR